MLDVLGAEVNCSFSDPNNTTPYDAEKFPKKAAKNIVVSLQNAGGVG